MVHGSLGDIVGERVGVDLDRAQATQIDDRPILQGTTHSTQRHASHCMQSLSPGQQSATFLLTPLQ